MTTKEKWTQTLTKTRRKEFSRYRNHKAAGKVAGCVSFSTTSSVNEALHPVMMACTVYRALPTKQLGTVIQSWFQEDIILGTPPPGRRTCREYTKSQDRPTSCTCELCGRPFVLVQSEMTSERDFRGMAPHNHREVCFDRPLKQQPAHRPHTTVTTRTKCLLQWQQMIGTKIYQQPC